MAMVEGRAFAQEQLRQSAALVLNAYFKAPLVTSRLEQKALLVSGEELMPMLELIEVLAQKVGGHEATQNFFFPLYVDYLGFRVAIDKGQSPVVLLLGANLARADVGWDCGACGFTTCGEMMKYFKEHGGPGRSVAGPSCAWKSLDWGIACDYACAAAWELNIENRILASFGLVANALGYMDDVTAVMALPLGPISELWYYNRPIMGRVVTPESQAKLLRNNIPVHWTMFAGDLKPPMKGYGQWWERPPEYVKVEEDPEFTEFQNTNKKILLEAVMEVRPKVEAIKGRLKENTIK
ncbi:MAG: DUF2148 domain-containing protein [Acidobacteriota bacterium]